MVFVPPTHTLCYQPPVYVWEMSAQHLDQLLCCMCTKTQVANTWYLYSATRDHLLDPNELTLLLHALALSTGQWNARAIETSMQLKSFPSLRCPGVTCSRILCADPRYTANDCCPLCNHSQCMFSGCVNLSDSQSGRSWKPEPCTTCRCVSGKQLCDKMACPRLDCPSELVATKPGVCCPYCNYSKIRCAVVSSKTVNISIAEYAVVDANRLDPGDRKSEEDKCVIQVTRHRCERKFLNMHGRMYKCVARSQKRHVSVDRRCQLSRAKISFTDVTQCVGHVLGAWKLRNNEPEPHCDFFVPNWDRIAS